MTVINLRGTNGSGKSTAVRKILIDHSHSRIKLTSVGDAGCYVPSLDLIVVGEYPYNQGGLLTKEPYALAGGGCDGFGTQDDVCEAVRKAHSIALNVLFEGIIVSTIYRRYAALTKELGDYIWAYMTTPEDIALQRVLERNGGEPIQMDTFHNKLGSIETTRLAALQDGFRVEMIPWEDPVPALLKLLK
jgi:hypothetical protein